MCYARLPMLRSFLASLQFLTVVPVALDLSAADRRLAAVFYPLVGALIGAGAAAVYWASSLVLPPSLSLWLVISFSIAVSGGLHEDGLSDCADAFGAGADPETTLEILRDSRIGAFGALSLILALSGKYLALLELDEKLLIPALIAGAALGRWAVLPLALFFRPARPDGLGSDFSRQVTAGAVGLSLLGLLGLGWFLQGPAFALYLTSALLSCLLFALYCRRRIGGLTGDCLGAAAIIGELVYYWILVASV